MMTKTKLGAALLLTMAAVGFQPQAADASSHREAPLISEDPAADNTDLWAFTSPENNGTVTIIAGYIGLEEPGGGPNWMNFSDDVLYEIKIDNNGDGNANDVVYQFRFQTTTNNALASGAAGTFFYNVGPITTLPTPAAPGAALRVQSYTVTRVVGGTATVIGSDIPTAPTYAGRFAFGNPQTRVGMGGTVGTATDDSNYTRISNQAITNLMGGASVSGRVFAGPRDDPFFADLGAIFDDAQFRSGFGNVGGGIDFLAGYNFHMIAIQVPINQLTVADAPSDINDRRNVIGVYASASRPRVTIRRDCNSTLRGRMRPLPQRFTQRCLDDNQGQWVQVSRLGIPLVNEVLIPLAEKDFWNRAPATDDVANFGSYLLVPSLPTYAQALYGNGAMEGLRAQVGYVAPTRSATDANNDMLQLVTARGLIPGSPAMPAAGMGFAPADLLRLNVRTMPTQLPTMVGNPGESRLGAAGMPADGGGFPNGRRLHDDVVDIELRYVLNGLARLNSIPFGDGVDSNDRPFTNTFPYVPIPLPGNVGPRSQRVEPTRGP